MSDGLPIRLYCRDFDFEDCCDSCHDEWDAGYGDPWEVDGPDGAVAYVCCRVSERLRTALANLERS